MMGMGNLNLSDAQKQQLKSVNEDFRNKMQTLDRMDEITVKEQRSRREALLQERKSKISSLLTTEQRKQFEENAGRGMNREQGGGRMGNREMGGGRMGNREDRLLKMKSDLGLTDDQMVKIKSSGEAFSQKAMAIHQDQSLSMDQKRAQMESLRKDREENLKSFLTADQVAKMKQMHHGDWKGKNKDKEGKEKIKVKTT